MKNILIKNQNGAALVEFAIICPLLILIALGCCEFGLLVYNKQVIVNGSREGARAGIVRGSHFLGNDDIKKIVKDYCNDRLIDFGGTKLSDADIVLSDRTAADFGDDFSVQVTYNYRFQVPSLFGFGSIQSIQHLALMKMEAIPST